MTFGRFSVKGQEASLSRAEAGTRLNREELVASFD